jgi:hypothetical protein
MHTQDVLPEEVTFVLLMNKKGFRVIPGSFHEDEFTFTFDFDDMVRGGRRRATVAKEFVASIEGAVSG